MALESNILGLWAAKQTAKGSPVTMTTGTKFFRWVGGDLNPNRADGTEQYSDNTLFGDSVDFVNTVLGNGSPVIQGQSGAIGYLAWLACGQETVTGGVNAVHTLSVSGTPTGGKTTLTLNGQWTFDVPYNATAAATQTAMLAAVNAQGDTLPAGSVTVGGGPLPGSPLTFTFGGALGHQPVPVMTKVDAFTGGSSPTSTVTLTTPGTTYQHVITPADSGGFWTTFAKAVGSSVAYRAAFNDTRISSLRFEGSSASKVVKVTPTLLSIDPGQLLSANPTTTDDGVKPFLWTEAAGTVKFDGTVFRGTSAFAAECQWGLQEWYGDTITPYDVINLRANVLLQGCTIMLDAAGLAEYYAIVYGTTTPAAGAKPIAALPALGSYEVTFNHTSTWTGGVSDSFKFEMPNVKWAPGLAIPANPAGGAVELPMAGEFRKDPLNPTTPPFRITINSSKDAAYAS